jgi:hypothetical protein
VQRFGGRSHIEPGIDHGHQGRELSQLHINISDKKSIFIIS